MKYIFQPAILSISSLLMEMDSRLMREHTPRARNMPVSVATNGGILR